VNCIWLIIFLSPLTSNSSAKIEGIFEMMNPKLRFWKMKDIQKLEVGLGMVGNVCNSSYLGNGGRNW
jgi:hypothetical protein